MPDPLTIRTPQARQEEAREGEVLEPSPVAPAAAVAQEIATQSREAERAVQQLWQMASHLDCPDVLQDALTQLTLDLQCLTSTVEKRLLPLVSRTPLPGRSDG